MKLKIVTAIWTLGLGFAFGSYIAAALATGSIATLYWLILT